MMSYYQKIICISMLLLVTCCTSLCFAAVEGASVDSIKFYTEEYPPFNFKKDGKLQGIAIDLMVRMLKEAKAKQGRGNIELVPWPRGYKTLLKKKNICLFSTTRTTEREKLFKWVGPIIPIKNVLLAKKDTGVKPKNSDDLKKLRIGVIKDDVAEQLLLQIGVTHNSLERVNSSLQNIKKLNKGRIDAWAYNETTAQWQIKQNGFSKDAYEAVYTLDKSNALYFAFNKETDDTVIDRLQKILDRLKQDGDYQKIVGRYLQ